MAKHLGSDHHEIELSEADFLAAVPDTVYHTESYVCNVKSYVPHPPFQTNTEADGVQLSAIGDFHGPG